MVISAILSIVALLAPQGIPKPKPGAKPTVKVLDVRPEKAEAQVGETLKVAFDLEITDGWYIYPTKTTVTGVPTTFEFESATVAGTVEEPKPKLKKVEGVGEYGTHQGRLTMTVPVRLKADVKPGPLDVEGVLKYQICSDVCVDGTTPVSIPLKVLEGRVEPAPVAAPPAQTGGAAATASKEFEEKGLLWLLGLSVLGGLISLVMPCVYPLIPITLTYFVKQAGVSRGTGFLLSSSYAAGIVVTFTGLGFLLILLLGAQGAQIFASNPWVNLAIATMFMIFALSLLGLFEIQLPASWTNALAGGGPRSGVGGAFVLGLLFSVVTFTCTIPIAATILGIAASEGHRMAGFLAMLVYSGTMAIPFLFLGLFPSMIKELPKSGGWLHTVKVTAGFFEIALAAAYIWKADLVWRWGMFDRGLVLAIFIAVCFTIASYLLGFFRVKDDAATAEIKFPRLASALLFAILGFFLIGGLLGRPVGVFNTVLPPEDRRTAGNGSGEKGEKVYTDLAEAEAVARKESKPLFVEFTGVT